jgi:hypothetical protein
MKRALRLVACLAISFVVVWLSGYGNVMNDISESLAVTAFLGAVLVLTMLVFGMWEMYWHFRGTVRELKERIEQLENKEDAKSGC